MKKKKVSNNESYVSSLRPLKLENFIGQKILKEKLRMYIYAAKKRNETLDHVLFYGPPGLGKTSLAMVITNEMGTKIHIVSGPSIEKIGDIASILNDLAPGDILFIDEIHRLPRVVEESLYTAMEDFKFSIIINREINPQTVTIDLPPFTLIGATTKIGMISNPLRARFGITEKFDFYDIDDLAEIVENSSKFFNVKIDKEAAIEIAKRSRGTPRNSNTYLKRIRDFVNFQNISIISKDAAIEGFKLLKIDSIGLNSFDMAYLSCIKNRFNGGPVGIENIANFIGDEVENIEEVIEPYLIKIGFIERTIKGRKLTSNCLKYLKQISFIKECS